jgi:hypothetical protein
VKEEQEEGRREDGSGEERARGRSAASIESMLVLGRLDLPGAGQAYIQCLILQQTLGLAGIFQELATLSEDQEKVFLIYIKA